MLAVALLNTRFRLIKFEAISQGIVNEALAHPREILKPAIIHSASAFVLMHNHPSGGPLDDTGFGKINTIHHLFSGRVKTECRFNLSMCYPILWFVVEVLWLAKKGHQQFERAFIDVLWSTLVVVSESCSRPTPCFLDLATRAYAGVYLLHNNLPERDSPLSM
jgi:hypothetical protein